MNKILLWIQKYIKTDMSYLVKGSFWLLLGQGMHMSTGFILSLAFANMLPKSDFGTYQFVMSTAAIIGSFTLTGIGIAIKKAVANGHEGALRYGFKIQMLWNLGIILSGGAISIYYFINGHNILAISFLVVGIFTPFIQSFSLYRSYLLGKQLFKETTLLGTWRKPLTLISVIITLFFTNNPAILIFVYFLSSTISLGWMYRIVIKKYNLPISKSESDLLSYSKHLSLIGLLRLVANNLDSILIFHFIDAPSVAIYALAKVPLTHITQTFGTIGNLAFPKFAKNEYSILRKTLFSKVFIYFITTLVVVVLFILSAPFIYETLFPTYTESILISQIIILSLLFKPATLFEKVFEAHALKKVQHITITSTLVFKIVTLIILLPLYGLWGAVASVIITHIYWCVMSTTLFYSYKYNKK